MLFLPAEGHHDRSLPCATRTRSSILKEPTFHEVFGIPVQTMRRGSEVIYLGLGCFWGAGSTGTPRV